MALSRLKIKISAILAWTATTLAGVFGGRSDKTDGKPTSSYGKSKSPELLATVGPYVYLSGLLVGLSSLTQACPG